jgi:hypothetical protein
MTSHTQAVSRISKEVAEQRERAPEERQVSDVSAFTFCMFAATAKIYLDSRLIMPPENTGEGFRDRPTAVFTIAASRSKHGG